MTSLRLLSRSLCLLLALLAPGAAMAQGSLPVLEAHSRTVDIRVGNQLLKGAWTADPAIQCDVYDAKRSAVENRITFLSDVDSVSFDVQPGHLYDFIILLNGTDSCRTRISTMKQSFESTADRPAGAPHTIPFAIRHGKIHVTATVNGSKPLDLMFDTGANIVCLRPSALAKGAKLEFDSISLNSGFGGTATRPLSRGNRLQVAALTWNQEPILYFDQPGRESDDGILGYAVFEDKVVEIDYDRSVLLIHDSMPPAVEGYARFPMRFDGGLPSVETTFNTGEKQDRGWFILDTGATAALQLRQDFVAAHGLYGTMKRVGGSASRGVGRGTVRNEVVLLPELAFGGFVLHNVPTHLEKPSAQKSVSSGCLLGMDVLKRFNTILDYPRSELHLKPNKLFGVPFRKRFGGPPAVLVVMIAVFAIALIVGVAMVNARRRSLA